MDPIIKYCEKNISYDDTSFTDIENAIKNLKYIKDQIKQNREKDCSRYKYISQFTRLVNNAEDITNQHEQELFLLHTRITAQHSSGFKIGGTDEETVARLQDRCTPGYKNIGAIPSGREFDDHRDFLRAKQRIAKRKKRKTKATAINERRS